MESEEDFDKRLADSELLRGLGVQPEFSDEPGPEPDIDEIRSFARRELDALDTGRVAATISRFRSWFTAYSNVIREAEFNPIKAENN